MGNIGKISLLTIVCVILHVLAAPEPKVIAGFKKFAHGVRSGDVTILSTKKILIKNFRYDGAGPDVFFWAGKGDSPNKNGKIIPNEKGSTAKLDGYEGKDITLTLPKDLSIKDIDYISVWCRRFSTNFGHVTIPKNLDVPSN